MQSVYRLRESKEFDYVYKRGSSQVCRNIVLITARSRSGLRCGFSVSKKIGKSVVRNRAKRLMRECFRLLIPRVRQDMLYVFVARSGITSSDFAGVRRDIEYLLKKAGMFTDGGNGADSREGKKREGGSV